MLEDSSESFGLFVNFAIILFLIVVNAFFVMAEVAFLTSSKSRLYDICQGKKSLNFNAKKAYEIIQQPEVFLSTAQVGITLMSLLLGLFGGGSLGEHLAEYLSSFEVLKFYSYYVGIFSYAVSFCIVTYFAVISEVFPKRIAMIYPETIAIYCAGIMNLVIRMIYPFVKLLSFSSQFFTKIFIKNDIEQKVSIEEIKFLVNQAFNSGILDYTEKSIVKRMVSMGNMQVGTIMTPRKQILSLDLEDDVEENIRIIKQHGFSHYPVIRGELSNLVGVVSIKSLFNSKEKDITNQEIERIASAFNILYVPEVSRITNLIELLKQHKTKVAIVMDEYGDIEGIVAFSDIIRTFFGDLGAFTGGERRRMIKKKDESYEVDGNIFIGEVMEKLDLSSLPDEDEEDYRTLASFILKQMEHIPKVGEGFVSEGWRFVILRMDGFRIDKVRISKVER